MSVVFGDCAKSYGRWTCVYRLDRWCCSVFIERSLVGGPLMIRRRSNRQHKQGVQTHTHTHSHKESHKKCLHETRFTSRHSRRVAVDDDDEGGPTTIRTNTAERITRADFLTVVAEEVAAAVATTAAGAANINYTITHVCDRRHRHQQQQTCRQAARVTRQTSGSIIFCK